MKRLTATICLTFAVLLGSAGTASALPPCPSDQTAYYDNCFGINTSPDGDKYVGEWRNNKSHGQGTFTFAKSGNKYVGEFRNNRIHGQGTYTYANGDKYVGEYRNDKRNGQFTVTYASGDTYVGEFRNGKKNGQGTKTYAVGHKYIGNWSNGQRNGQGTFTFADGRTKEGVFKAGTFQYARSAAQLRRDLKNKERKRKEAQQLRQKRRDRYKAALTKCLFDNVEKVINEYAKRIVEAECRRKIKK